MERHVEAVVFGVTMFAVAFVFGSIAHGIGGLVNAPPVKSDKEMCVERGGVWVAARGPRLCFSKEAFK